MITFVSPISHFCLHLKIESFDEAEAYRANLRSVEPAVYNDARLRESPIPHLSFASESNDDDIDDIDDNDDLGLVSLSADSSEGLADYDVSSTANNSMEFVSFSMQSTSFEEQIVNEPASGAETEQKNPLDDVELDATQSAAINDIFGVATQSDICTTDDTAAEKNPSGTIDDGNGGQSIEMFRDGMYIWNDDKNWSSQIYSVFIDDNSRPNQDEINVSDNDDNTRNEAGSSNQGECNTGAEQNAIDSTSCGKNIQNDAVGHNGKHY